MAEIIRIVLVDDHPLFREGVAYTLGAQADMEVVAQGESRDEAARLAERHAPDVLLLDINIPGGGIEAARAIAAARPAIRIIMLTASVDEDDLAAAMAAGAGASLSVRIQTSCPPRMTCFSRPAAMSATRRTCSCRAAWLARKRCMPR